MVCAFKGWNDAGEAASAALGVHLADASSRARSRASTPRSSTTSRPCAPRCSSIEGLTREIEWPENTFPAAPVPGAEGDLVMLQGVEPRCAGARFTDDVVDGGAASSAWRW